MIVRMIVNVWRYQKQILERVLAHSPMKREEILNLEDAVNNQGERFSFGAERCKKPNR